MQNKHPKATLLKINTFPDEGIQFSEAQYLQITAVAPEPDKSALIFTNPDVPTGELPRSPYAVVTDAPSRSCQGLL